MKLFTLDTAHKPPSLPQSLEMAKEKSFHRATSDPRCNKSPKRIFLRPPLDFIKSVITSPAKYPIPDASQGPEYASIGSPFFLSQEIIWFKLELRLHPEDKK